MTPDPSSRPPTRPAAEVRPGPDSPPLAVTMVTGSLSRRAGGLFHSVRRLAQSLAEQGLRVSVVGLRDPDTDADLPAWAPLAPIVLDAARPRALGGAWGLGAAIRGTRPDVLHQHGIWLAMSATSARLARRLPVMISPRGMLDPWALRNSAWKKRLAWHGWEARNLRRAACLHALAESEARSIRDLLPRARVETVPNGVDLPPGPLPPRDPSGRRRLLFLGRLHPKKGLPDLFRQWTALPPDLRAGWEIVVAGPDQGGHRAELERLGRELGLADGLRFTGPLLGDAKRDALARAHAFVLPSRSEGLPMAVLEAWAAGLPVLMTAACNLPEGFAAGAAAEIATGDDPRPLLSALSRADLPAMGARGRRLVEERFTWDRIAARHADIYADLRG